MSNLYIDSRGAEMDGMSFTEALVVTYDLANLNQIDERDMAFDDAGLAEQHQWQQQALDVMLAILAHHRSEIDALLASTRAGDWDESLVSASRDMDPQQPDNAIRICLDMAEQGALGPREVERDAHLADEIDRQQMALDIVRDLIGMHSAALERIEVISISPSMTPGT